MFFSDSLRKIWMNEDNLARVYSKALSHYALSELMFSAKQPPPLEGSAQLWSPYYIRRDRLVWVDMQGQSLNTPFVRGGFNRSLRDSDHQARITRVEALESISEIENSIPLSGFVFHISRCGSTLFRNILGETTENLCLGEPPFLTPVLAGTSSAVKAQLRGGIKALGRNYTGKEKRFFVKLQSLHIGKINLFEQVFPHVPKMFIYRDPFEVFQKVVNSGGCSWLVIKDKPHLAAQFTGLDPELIQSLSKDEYAARVIGRYYEIAAEHSQYGLGLLNYRNLSDDTQIRRALRFFGVSISAGEFERIHMMKKNNAKRPMRTYSVRESAQLSSEQRNLVEKWAVEPYNKLEALCELTSVETCETESTKQKTGSSEDRYITE